MQYPEFYFQYAELLNGCNIRPDCFVQVEPITQPTQSIIEACYFCSPSCVMRTWRLTLILKHLRSDSKDYIYLSDRPVFVYIQG